MKIKNLTIPLLIIIVLLLFSIFIKQQTDMSRYRALLSEIVSNNIAELHFELNKIESIYLEVGNMENIHQDNLSEIAHSAHVAAFYIYDNLNYALQLDRINMDEYNKGYSVGNDLMAIKIYLSFLDLDSISDEEKEKIKLILKYNRGILNYINQTIEEINEDDPLSTYYSNHNIITKHDFWFQVLIDLQKISENILNEHFEDNEHSLSEYLN